MKNEGKSISHNHGHDLTCRKWCSDNCKGKHSNDSSKRTPGKKYSLDIILVLISKLSPICTTNLQKSEYEIASISKGNFLLIRENKLHLSLNPLQYDINQSRQFSSTRVNLFYKSSLQIFIQPRGKIPSEVKSTKIFFSIPLRSRGTFEKTFSPI